MNIVEALKSAVKQLAGNKGRTILTMMGMFIGIGSVIMILALGNGLRDSMMGEFADIGLGIFSIQVKSDLPENRITQEEIQMFREMPGVECLIAANSSDAKLVNQKGKEFKCYIIGGEPEYTTVFNKIEILYGRNLNQKDEQSGLQNVLIADSVAKGLYGEDKDLAEIIGEPLNITIDEQVITFEIVGIYDGRLGSNASQKDLEDSITYKNFYVPYATLDRIKGWDGKVAQVGGLTGDDYDQVTITTQIGQILNRRHHLKDGYTINTAVTMMEMADSIMSVITLFISAIASISLIVGGVGIMNIMLVTVKERTKEIGIRKALGAPNKVILGQFLVEALLLTVVAGVIGMLIGYVGAFLVAAKINVHASFTLGMILFATLTSTAIGVLFGVYPAYQAAKLDPVEALRAE